MAFASFRRRRSLKRVVVDLRTGTPPDFATISVALQAVRRLAQD